MELERELNSPNPTKEQELELKQELNRPNTGAGAKPPLLWSRVGAEAKPFQPWSRS